MPSQASSSNIRWVLIFWMFLISAISYLDRVNISIAGRDILKEFHLTNIQLGWIFSAFVLGYALFQTPGGALADRIGPRLVLTLGVIWWGIFTCLITFASPLWASLIPLLIAIRFCLGIGEAVLYPASNCVVSNWIPTSERGIANGIIFAGVGFGAGVTSPLINYLVLHHGWRSSFWVSAAIGVVAGAIWFAVARDKPEQHPRISQSELDHIKSGLPPIQMVGKGKSTLPWKAILTNRNVLTVTFSYFAYGYAAYIFFTWFFIYLSTVRGMNLKQSGYYTMLPFIAMAVCSTLGGWISDRLTRSHGVRVGRCGIAGVSMALCALLIAASTQVNNVPLATLVLASGAGALYLSQSSFWSVSAGIGKSSAGSVSGFMNMGGQFGGALTASLTPLIAAHLGWTASFLVAAALCLAGALAWAAVSLDEMDEPAYDTGAGHRDSIPDATGR